MKGRPEDWTRVVAANMRSTLAFIVSGRHPNCLEIVNDEVRHINRWMKQCLLDSLPAKVPGSWFMAVVVCPGDDLRGLAAWMTKHGGDRVRFYLHRGASPRQLAPVNDAGHDLRHVRPERYTSYGELHKRLGLDLSDQIYEDFRPL
jgi:hypothetical protein